MNVSNSEERLTFFREDLGLNSHHFHWHIIYPTFGQKSKQYANNRRGEIFYYVHHQMMVM